MRNYDFGNRIYELRRSMNMSQKELGEMVGVSNKSVSKWENGTAMPKTETIVKLAEVFKISPLELLQGKTDDKLTLSQLSSQANEFFLKEEISKRDNEKSRSRLVNSKKYLIILCSLFASVFITLCIINILGLSYIEEGMLWYEVAFASLVMSYLVSSVFSGIVFAVNVVKRLPAWALVLFCLFFPLTLMAIEFIGIVITPSYVINSIKDVIKDKKNG